MTVIAWDGRTLAGDRQSTYSGTPTRTRKVFRIKRPNGHVLAGCSGHSGECQYYVRWAQGKVKDKLPFTNLNVLSIDERRRIWIADERLIWERVRHDFWAIGSGSSIALGAMAAVKTAREAVLIANRLDTGCGFGVDVVRFP